MCNPLADALTCATHLQAGIGFWTINAELLGPNLLRTLQHERGFACVDLHPPTEVEALADVVQQGGRVRVYYEDIPSKPPLFWMPDGTAELWVGSHNWTKRALLGLNVGASLVVRATQASRLVAASAQCLARMQAIAEPFDLAKVDVYRQPQRRMTTGLTPVIELEAEDGASASQSIIRVLGTNRKDLTKLGTVRREIHVALLDPKSDAQFVYPATILHSGLLQASDAAAGGTRSRRAGLRIGMGSNYPCCTRRARWMRRC